MADPNRILVARLLLMSAATMTVLAVLAWYAVLPVNPESQYLLTLVLGTVAALEAGIGVLLLVRT